MLIGLILGAAFIGLLPGVGGVCMGGLPDCQWSGWGGWGACTARCGGGKQWRSRSICCPAGTRNDSGVVTDTCKRMCGVKSAEFWDSRKCNLYCYNGGAHNSTSGECTCSDGYYGKCCMKKCEPVQNCEPGEVICSNQSDSSCKKCLYDMGGDVKAYRLNIPTHFDTRVTQRNSTGNPIYCEELCSWRNDSSFCYPGICPDAPDSCVCAPGFTGYNCLTITKKPDITLSSVSFTGNGSDFIYLGNKTQDKIIFSNLSPVNVEVEWTAGFPQPQKAFFPQPYYVNEFNVGITSASLELLPNDMTELPIITSTNETFSSNLYNDSNQYISTFTFIRKPRQGERIDFICQASAGGFITTNNFDQGLKPLPGEKHYYSSTTASVIQSIVFDYEPPVRCNGDKCGVSELVFDSTKNVLIVLMDGWNDDISGIDRYKANMEMFTMEGTKSSFLPHPTWQSWSENDESKVEFNLKKELDICGYCLHIEVVDKAGNMASERRCFILHEESVITKNNLSTWDHCREDKSIDPTLTFGSVETTPLLDKNTSPLTSSNQGSGEWVTTEGQSLSAAESLVSSNHIPQLTMEQVTKQIIPTTIDLEQSQGTEDQANPIYKGATEEVQSSTASIFGQASTSSLMPQVTLGEAMNSKVLTTSLEYRSTTEEQTTMKTTSAGYLDHVTNKDVTDYGFQEEASQETKYNDVMSSNTNIAEFSFRSMTSANKETGGLHEVSNEEITTISSPEHESYVETTSSLGNVLIGSAVGLASVTAVGLYMGSRYYRKLMAWRRRRRKSKEEVALNADTNSDSYGNEAFYA